MKKLKRKVKNPKTSVDGPGEICVTPQEELGEGKGEEVATDYQWKQLVYFAFIDILGFKKTFDDNRDEISREFAEKFRDVFNYFFELMAVAPFMDKDECYAGQTSDSLYFYCAKVESLLDFLYFLSHFSAYAMTKDVFFRGGIARGSLFNRESYQFYGNSVIRAYLLESDIAKNPVICIDENTYNELNNFSGDIAHLVKRSTSQRYYLAPFAGFANNDMERRVNYIVDIRDTPLEAALENIRTNKELFEYDAKNFGKYAFLSSEYEAFIRENK